MCEFKNWLWIWTSLSNIHELEEKVANDLIDFVTMVKSETGETPKFIRCDNTGENVKVSEISKKKEPQI